MQTLFNDDGYIINAVIICIMKADAPKHYKFINSKTGYAIFYCTIGHELTPEQVKESLEKTRTQVAVQNNIFIETIYWEEVKDDQ